jgi:hypothetical protein
MDVQEKEALQILQGAFWVNPDDHLKEFKTKYRKWLLQGNHPDTGGSGQNFDRVRQAYHVHANYLNGIHKQSPVAADSTNYYEFTANAVARGNYFPALWLILQLYVEYHLGTFIQIARNRHPQFPCNWT